MVEWGVQPEHVQQGLNALGLLALSMAFTAKQRGWIRDRDNNECQFPGEHDHGGRLEVHHILGQRYCYDHDIDPDYPENGLTICQDAHKVVHPDMDIAFRQYPYNRDSFKDMQRARDEKLRRGEVYWNQEFDEEMQEIAIENTEEFEAQGQIFPPKRGNGSVV